MLIGIAHSGLLLIAREMHKVENQKLCRECMAVIRDSARKTSLTEFMMRVADFHYRLHELTGNEYLNDLLAKMHLSLFSREIANRLPIEDWDGYVGNYQRITDALLDCDGDAASQACREHIEDFIRRLKATA